MFVVFEGMDGSGKTTQARLVYDWLIERLGEESVLLTREPGGWEGGVALRELILGGSLSNRYSEYFLFMADRCEHVERVIGPALAEGKVVLCDRYDPSTLAYQIYSDGGIPPERADGLAGLSGLIGLPKPDLMFFLDLDEGTARARLDVREKSDAFDRRGDDYFRAVRAGYVKLMELYPANWIRIDARRDIEPVFDEIIRHLTVFLENKG